MMGGQVVTWVSSFILLIFLPRYLGSESFGRLYLALSISIILEVLIDFGGNYLIPKEVSREKSRTAGIMVNFMFIRILTWVIAMGGLLVFTWLAGYPPVTQLLIVILGISRLWEGAKRVLRSCFQGHEQMEYPSIGAIAERVFVSAVAVSALLLGAGAVTVAVIMAVGILINFLVLAKFSTRIIDHIPSIDWQMTRRMIRISLPYFLWSLFSVIYFRIDAVMLSLLSNDSVVGWYGAAYRFFDIVMVFPSIFTTVVFPIFARLWVDEQKEMFKTFQMSLKYMVLLALPVSVLIFYYSRDIVSLFFGLSEYTPSVIVLQIFAAGILLVYIDFILGSTILATDKQRKWAFIGLIAIFINIGLNYFAIIYAENYWQNGGIGAAVTTLITELFIMFSALLLLPGNYVKSIRIPPILKMIPASAVMVACCWLMSFTPIYWIIQAAVAGLIYLVAVWYMDIFDEREQNLIRKYSDIKKFWSLIANKERTTA